MSAAARSTGRVSTRTAPTQTVPVPSAQHTTAKNTTAEPAPAAPAEPAYELVDLDRYEVFDDGPVGYVEVIPPLFICYSGHPYPKAVEVAQVFDFEQAVRRVRDAAAHTRAPHEHRRSAA